ncbi:MAG: type II secretion system minor pseudopilin GspJ [Desulfurivibrio sp.]|nr:type II secretion system minor pseudopilin GspJ [Desulfurivibrio sp.]
MNRRWRGCQRGFTLLELMVALALFALLSMVTFTSLQSLIDSRERTREESRRLAAIQMAVSRLTLDLQQLRPRGIRDQYGDPRPALLAGEPAGEGLEFTRGSRPAGDPARPGGGLQRVRYLLEDRELFRDTWPVLDRGPRSEYWRQSVLSGVDGFAYRLLDQQGQWHDRWPPAAVGFDERGEQQPADDSPPVAVELVLELEDWGRIRRLLPLVQGPLADD